MRQNPHVRICGGPGAATTLVYPTAPSRRVFGIFAALAEFEREPIHERTLAGRPWRLKDLQ